MEKYKFRNTDVMAYYAWVAGDWKKAHKYIAMLEKPTLLSLYIEAQLARMAGNSDLTLKKLHAWLKMVKEIKPEKYRDLLRRREPGWGSEDSFEYEVYGMMGNTLVMRKDFIQAAEFFCRSGQMETDFAIVAEEYMSLEELIKFADLRIKEFNSRKDQSKDAAKTLQCITHLLARRAFRESRMDIAQKYMPREHKQLLSDYLNFIAQGQNKKIRCNPKGQQGQSDEKYRCKIDC